MKITNKMLLLALLSTTLVACGKKEEPTAPATPAATTTPAPAATAPAATPPAATPAPVATAPASPMASTDAAPAGALPEACEAYLTRATACYEKAASANAAAVDQMKQSLEQVRTQWNAVPDKSQLGTACTMANEQFAQTVTMLKCE